ncbi:hypothetical protein M231_05138 [Tremella mesenterica]|uniref:polynucleotide adenylyltransferase n=1 Tax=Tremella mesenterica TaxID=5217 RepID=A0A4Q1BIX1_TREME|nr:hypothetical protein M231_05138 [Tremella mesenterica]
MHPGVLHRRFLNDLSSSLFSFVLPLLPTNEELHVKEEVRGLIEKLIKTIEPSARLLSFGSSCNSFGLRNSDMDLVVLIDDSEANIEPSHFVAMIADLLERETNFDVKPLPKARIPILKLNLKASTALPFGIACDIGIENRLAIENTRLLLTYATIDPARVRTLVLFLKVWAKRRRINSPYRGTLSSYGFTLMVLYYLVHVKQPPVLPNLQRIAPLRPMTEDQYTLEGKNVYFFDDVETLRNEWSSINFESVGELLIDFFRYFSHDFQFNNSVLSLRAGQLTKESKGWVNDIDVGGVNEMARDRNRLCIEDPFETTYNVARTVTKDGLYTIRGEFMRATRILTQRPDRAVLALAELCREREEELSHAPRSASPAPRALSATRTPYTHPTTYNGYRSQSQTPFERLGPVNMYETPVRRGRQSESDSYDVPHSAQDLWLRSQGPNLGGMGSLGLSDTFERGREMFKGLETPGMTYRQSTRLSTFDNVIPSSNSGSGQGQGQGSGSMSAPMSPHRLYAQLEMGKGLLPNVHWPNYDNTSGTITSTSSIPSLPTISPHGSNPTRSESLNRSRPLTSSSNLSNLSNFSNSGIQGMNSNIPNVLNYTPGNIQEPMSPLPPFMPFSPPMPQTTLRPLNGEPANYISPSTLLSPPTISVPLSGDSNEVSHQSPQNVPGQAIGGSKDGFNRLPPRNLGISDHVIGQSSGLSNKASDLPAIPNRPSGQVSATVGGSVHLTAGAGQGSVGMSDGVIGDGKIVVGAIGKDKPDAVDTLVKGFNKLGVDPPGQGVENDAKVHKDVERSGSGR